VIDAAIESGVPHAALFSDFVEAVLSNDTERLVRARTAIGDTLGPDAVVDTAGATASFNAVVKVADGTGVEVEDFKAEGVKTFPKALSEQLERSGSYRAS